MQRKNPADGRKVSKLALGLLGAASGLVGLAGPALAQDSGDDEIVVTATRREQALQDVPIAVSAYNAEALDQQNITSTQDLQRVAPSLVISSSNSETGGSTLRIRGVGTTGNNIGLEGAVGVFIDGVYRQRAGLALNNLFDVGRVEVLRGPQGTLFGKNTSAGALAIVTNPPRMGQFQASAEFSAGDYDDLEFQGMVNVPVTGEFAVRLSGAMQGRDGYMVDPRTNTDYFNRNRALARLQALWEPTDDVSVRVTLDGASKDEDCCQASYRWLGATALANLLLGGVAAPADLTDRFDRTVYNTIGVPTPEHTEEWGITAHVGIDLDFADFRAILAHRDFDFENLQDADFGPADLLRQAFPAEQTLDSIELQLTGTTGRLDWLVGAYYSEEEIDQTFTTTFGAQTGAFVNAISGAIPDGPLPAATGCGVAGASPCYPFGGGNISNNFFQESTSWSIFTHNTFNFTDQFSATLGLRYNSEEKTGGGRNFVVNSPACSATYDGAGPLDDDHPIWASPSAAGLRTQCPRPNFTGQIDEEELTGIFSLNWSPTDDILVYASYSHGYKAGGINLDRDATVRPVVGPVLPDGTVVGTQAQIDAASVFLPETSDSYEFGLRTQWFDRALTVNLTGFITDYTDFQLNTFTGLGFIISNPGSVESHGVELESRWTPTDNLALSFAATWVEARYGTEPALQVDPDGAGVLLPLAGRQLTNAPDWTVTGGVHYEHPIVASGNVSAFFDLGAQYRSDYNTGSDLDFRKAQESYTTFDGRIGLTGEDSAGDWNAYVWGTNLTDEDIHVISFTSVFQAGSISSFLGAPRMYGVTIRRRFN